MVSMIVGLVVAFVLLLVVVFLCGLRFGYNQCCADGLGKKEDFVGGEIHPSCGGWHHPPTTPRPIEHPPAQGQKVDKIDITIKKEE